MLSECDFAVADLQEARGCKVMKDIIIVGAGHLGIDVYGLLCSINDFSNKWNIKGFINDVPLDITRFRLPIGIIGSIENWQPSSNEVFAMAIGSPLGKKQVAEKLKARGAMFETLISPNASVARTAVIGEGAVVFAGSQIAPCATIGKFACIGNSIIGMDATIGDYSNTAAWVNVYQDVIVGKRCQLWSHSVILNKVGDDAIVGAGSVVISKVRSGTKVFGNPAKKLDF